MSERKSSRMLLAAALCAGLLGALHAPTSAADEAIEFNRDIRPILANHCFTCHGPDSATREAGLRLDRRESATQAAESGAVAVAAGDAANSELIRRVISTDPDVRMPPADGPKPLNEKQIALLRRWIDQGAEYQPHWSFVAPRQPAAPTVEDPQAADWPRNEVDRFVLARLQREGLHGATVAAPETLIRRVAFDLTGLPPTLQEIDAFLADRSPQAYQRMVDRYFESEAYGEHMARHWLDLARYADSNGYQYDTERQQWVWRDWVIDAYNRNLPFDQFTIEQLAGDLLPEATPQQRLATGFNRNHGITIEGGIIDEEYRTEYVMDRLVTTGEVWLGLTVGCARCHEHKFDPLSQKEFYQLYAFFNQVPERGMRGFDPREKLPSPLAASQQTAQQQQLAQLQQQLKQPLDVEPLVDAWAERIGGAGGGWQVLKPRAMKSTGGTKLSLLEDNSLLAGDANPRQDVYEIAARTDATQLTAVRLEAMTHPSLPGGGPGRHSNSNFVLSEFEATAASLSDPSQRQTIKFVRAIADYSQAKYEVSKAIDGTAAGNNGWAVDGPTRKEPATAVFVAAKPFGFTGGTELTFRLRHEASFATHGIGRPRLSVTADAADSLQLQGIAAEIRQIADQPRSARSAEQARQLRDYFLAHHHPHGDLRRRIKDLEQKLAADVPATMIMQDLASPRPTYILHRGQYNEPTEEVAAGVPAVFPPLPQQAPANRLGFARWLVDPAHPLTARVAVNRYWERLFGMGLVKTSEDFGVQGELPSHPQLLDWLALEFVRSGWNVKHIQRLMLLSATYRQSSHAGPAAYARDPENRLLARGPRMRLDAEEIRDATLAASGLLVRRIGGKSVYPYQPKGLWMELNNRPGYSKEYPQGSGDDLHRRSMYTFWKRTVPSPMLKTLDAPEREFCTIRRSRTNTPLQALLLLNGPQFVEAARHLGQRMRNEGGAALEQRLALGFRLVTARRPTADELEVLRESHRENMKRYSADPEAARRLLQIGDSAAAPLEASSEAAKLNEAAELAAWTAVARLLLNLDEAITKG